MVPKTLIVHLFTFIPQFVDIFGNSTYTTAGCFPNQFSARCNLPREKMYPKLFTTRNFETLSQCGQLISSKSLTGKPCEQCCQNLTTVKPDMGTYELPAGALNIPGRDKLYKDFVTQCIGRQYCTLGGNGGGRIQMDSNCIMFEYECVDDDQILNFTRDIKFEASQVFLLHNQTIHSDNNSHCVAYTCQSSMNVNLVANTMNSSCTLILSEEGGSPTVFKCEDTINNNTLFQSNDRKIDITLNMMTSSVDTSAKGLLWIRVTASDGRRVSVACGSKIPTDVTQHCPKVTTGPHLVPTVNTAVPGTTHAKTPSRSNIPIIGGVIGGLTAVLCLSAFAIYKKCQKTNKVEDESAMAASVDAPFNGMPKTPDSRRTLGDSASGTDVVDSLPPAPFGTASQGLPPAPFGTASQGLPPAPFGAASQGLPPAPFGAASLQMPGHANSLPPMRHIDLNI